MPGGDAEGRKKEEEERRKKEEGLLPLMEGRGGGGGGGSECPEATSQPSGGTGPSKVLTCFENVACSSASRVTF